MAEPHTPWPHAPTHQLGRRGTYFLTTGTYRKAHFFRDPKRLRVLHRGLLTVTRDFHWQLEAWAVFSNHYHFVAHSPADAATAYSLSQMLGVCTSKPPNGSIASITLPDAKSGITSGKHG